MVSTERLLSLSAIEGLLIFSAYREKHQNLNTTEIIQLIEKVDSNGHSLDLIASVELESLVGKLASNNSRNIYQNCIHKVLIARQPNWISLMKQGRMRFIKSLGLNDYDVFSAAGLLDPHPTSDVVSWWDRMVADSRQIVDLEKMEQARNAERLTIKLESERLVEAGINKAPEWPGLDNNFAGYDVLSYIQGDYGIENKMIEVKSTVASPLRFYISRNEWNQAEKYGQSYIFHVWDMAQSPPILYERTVSQISPHIPSDNEKGAWKSAEIPLSAGS